MVNILTECRGESTGKLEEAVTDRSLKYSPVQAFAGWAWSRQ